MKTEAKVFSDEIDNQIGAVLAEVLRMQRDPEHYDRWITTIGTKTNIGLARTIRRIMTEGEQVTA